MFTSSVTHRFGTCAIASTNPRRASRLLIAAALLAGVVIALLAPGSPASASASYHSTTSTEARIESAVLGMINQERRAHHLRGVTANSRLRAAARGHSYAMARANLMSHQVPNEAVFTKRFERAGYRWQWAGENVAWNSQMDQNGVLALQRMMYNEKAPDDGHRQNILNSHFHDVGVDVFYDSTHHKVWLTTDFGLHA